MIHKELIWNQAFVRTNCVYCAMTLEKIDDAKGVTREEIEEG